MKRRRTIIIVAILSIGMNSFAQKAIDSFEVCNLPVRNGIVYQYDPKSFHCSHSEEIGVSILTKCDSVFHIEEGKVVAVYQYDTTGMGNYMIVIRNGKDDFFAYCNLSRVFMKKGDIIKRNDCIGFSGTSEDEKGKQVDVMFLRKDKLLPFRTTVQRIRCNKQICEQPAGYTL